MTCPAGIDIELAETIGIPTQKSYASLVSKGNKTMNCTIESTRPHLEPGEEVYAIDYILIGGVRRTLAVCAFSGDEAFLMCRDNLRKRGLMSAALQGSPRIATTGDIARSDD